MESQPQNPEFRNNPENFHPCPISPTTKSTSCLTSGIIQVPIMMYTLCLFINKLSSIKIYLNVQF